MSYSRKHASASSIETFILTLPLFDLSRTGSRKKPILYDDGKQRVEVHAGPDGMMTHFDKDLLIYVASILAERVNKGEAPSPVVRFTGFDMMRVAGWDCSGKGYKRFENAMKRAQSTTIKTNIEMGGKGQDAFFSWFGEAKIQYKKEGDKKRMLYAEVTLCDWLYRGIISQEMTLTYNRDYFEIKSPIHRRIYEIARAFCGDQAYWQIGIEKLLERVGTTSSVRRFKQELKRIEEDQPLPEYDLRLVHDQSSEWSKSAAKDGFDSQRPYSNKGILVAFFPKEGKRRAAISNHKDPVTPISE